MTATSVAYRWGVRERTTTEWRTLLRIAGGIWIANAVPGPAAYGFGRADMPHPMVFLVNSLVSLCFGAVLIAVTWTLSDSLIESGSEGLTLALFALGVAALALSMYSGGIHFSAPSLLAFDAIAILAFYLLRRSAAVAVCFMATAWYAVVLLAFGTRGGEWVALGYLALSLLVTGFLTGRLIDQLDRERVAKEEARAQLADLNASLEDRVAEQVEEIRDSRARIVAASDESRRRIERNIHDGAQQQLVAISLDLQMLAEDTARLSSADIRAQLEATHLDLKGALDELRDLARGLHPTILTTDGLEAALDQLAARAPLPVSLSAPSVRFAEPIETAAFFVASEALANAVKYAAATAIEIRLQTSDSTLELVVCDDGQGGASLSPGGGLAGLADRVAALGGSLSVTSPAGAGTTVAASLPLACVDRKSGASPPVRRQHSAYCSCVEKPPIEPTLDRRSRERAHRR